MSKSVLIINASPRANGHISQLLAMAREALVAEGCKVTVFAVAGAGYRHCTGCMVCRSKGDCVLPADDGQRLAALLREHDRIIVGTPCYWGNIPGLLKGLFDRVVYAMMDDNRSAWPQPLMRGKKAAVIATSTTPWPWNRLFRQTSGAVGAVKEIFRYSGIRIVGSMQKGNTHRHPGLNSHDIRTLRKLVKRLLR